MSKMFCIQQYQMFSQDLTLYIKVKSTLNLLIYKLAFILINKKIMCMLNFLYLFI